MTNDERWKEIEEYLSSIALDVSHRSFAPGSRIGARHLLLLMRRHVVRIEELLLEDEVVEEQACSQGNI